MPKRFMKMLAIISFLAMLTSLVPVSVFANSEDSEPSVENATPTAMFGTPQLGSNDYLWSKTEAYPINRSTVPDDPRPHATGTVKVLWDYEYVYARVVVEDSNLYIGAGGDHTYDSVEFFVGPGSSGSNQWRVSATGVFSGQSHTDRAAWTEITDTGYIVEIRIPKRDLNLAPGKFTFEVNINNSTEQGADRYEVVSAFGTPDSGFNSDAAFRDSMELVLAEEADERYSIILSTETGGTIMPNAPGNVLRAVYGSDIEFTVTPDPGKIVDTVTVDGEAVAVDSDNKFSLFNISADHRIHVTFQDDSSADQIPFTVWNDNFARGEYTTALIIDLGEGKKALGSELHPGLFTVSARNTTLDGETVVFEGRRNISRVYANDEPKVRGYLGKVSNSPDYQEGLESGRYIVVELEFYTEVGGNITLDENSNSTKQNYNIVQNDEIVLTEGDPISYAVFKQTGVVNPILDKFTAHSTDAVNYALYIHKDEAGEEVQGLPLYVYTHGFSRGGTQSQIDQKASMKSANGSVALMKRMEKDPNRYASHILNISYSGGSAPQVSAVKAVIDGLVAEGLVDPNRIYVSGFSMGGGVTTNLINTYPGFFAAAAPLGISSGWPTAEENRDLAYWLFVNTYDSGASNVDNMLNDIAKLNNARASRFDSNEALTWPYNQYDQPSQRPNLEETPPLLRYIAHEVEAAVLYNQITMEHPFIEGETWSMAPIIQSPNLPAWNNDYTDIFDWMFSQRKPGPPDAPSDLQATAGDGRVTLRWNAPANDGGFEILGYKVWYDDEAPVTVAESTYTFTGLTNGQEYIFKVVATNEKGDSAATSVKATPSSAPYIPPVVTIPDSSDKDDETDDESSQPSYTLNTPEDQPAVTDEDGNMTLPGGGEIVTEGGTKIHVPAGTTIDAKGKVVVGSGGATVSLDSGFSFNVRAGAELLLDDTALGFTVVSGNPFHDVNEHTWYYSYVNLAYTFGLFDGTSATTYSPEVSMTRAMFVQVLANLENVDRSVYKNSRFSDVADGQWYTAAVEWAAQNGIVNGISADLFDPNGTLTREQMLVILYNYMNYKGYEIPLILTPAFADESEISPWALEAVQALQGINIVTGKGNNVFDPKGTASRSEVATIFVRFIEFLAK